MDKRGLIILIFLLSMTYVYAQEEVVFTLKDINTNEQINNAVVYLTITDAAGQQVYDGAVNINQSLDLSLENGSYEMIFRADLPDTPGMDYFRKKEVDTGMSQDIFLFPVGSLRGIVKDKLDNIVSNADLSFECVNNIGTYFPKTATKFGSVSVESMPTGSCKIFANYADAVGFDEISLNKGELLDMEIKLDKSIVASKGVSPEFIIIILVILFIFALIIYKLTSKESKLEKRTEKEEKKEKEEEKEVKKLEKEMVGKRAKDIMLTLNAKEKSVVDYLLDNKHIGSQARIRHETRIPRTSLTRVLSSLESKRIVKIEKHGKLVKVKLTPWFLGKE